MMRGWCVERQRNNQPVQRDKERTRGWHGAQREDEERRCDNKLARRVDKRVAQRDDGKRLCNNQLAQQDDERAAQ